MEKPKQEPSEEQKTVMAEVLKFAPSKIHEADLAGPTTVTGFEPIRMLPPLHTGPSILNAKVVSISDLINQCNEAASKMSAGNDNRNLIMNCAWAMRQLVDRLAFHEGEGKVT